MVVEKQGNVPFIFKFGAKKKCAPLMGATIAF
jgi:hypothetical protein